MINHLVLMKSKPKKLLLKRLSNANKTDTIPIYCILSNVNKPTIWRNCDNILKMTIINIKNVNPSPT